MTLGHEGALEARIAELYAALLGLFGDGAANSHLDSECGPTCPAWRAAKAALEGER